eukprot:104308-Pelagomonas_calceolata.AAC.1
MEELGCYIDGQRQVIDAADMWACPACTGLNNAQKIDRGCQSRELEELIQVTWMPSWEPEETKETWPKIQQYLLESEAKQSKPDLSPPTADFALSNLERQLEGFEKPDAINTRRQKLDTELCNKITFDIHPTNPQVGIKPFGYNGFWLHDIDLVKYKLKQNLNETSLDTESHHDSPQPRAPPPLILLETPMIAPNLVLHLPSSS